jgi:hypothetical protein
MLRTSLPRLKIGLLRRQELEKKTSLAYRISTLVIGSMLPGISAASDLNYKLAGLNQCKLLHKVEGVPTDLGDIESDRWNATQCSNFWVV